MPLKSLLINRIKQQGPLSIAQFMQEALCHPEYGYYSKQNPFGAGGDFITAPEISQMFGEMIGIWCALQWQQLGSPSSITLIEIGGGRGTLMLDFLRATKHIPGFHDALHLIMVENSPYLTQTQQKTLSNSGVNIRWDTSFNPPKDHALLIIANELFDALPIKQYVKRADGWHEKKIGIGTDEDQLIFQLDPHITPLAIDAPDDTVYEMCPAGEQLMTDIASTIHAQGGASIVIDYGYTEPTFNSSLQAVQSHTYCSPLDNVGDVDLTAHVNFQTLGSIAQQHGCNILTSTQGEFLEKLGIHQRFDSLAINATPSQREELESGLIRLTSPDQMGTLFKCLEIWR